MKSLIILLIAGLSLLPLKVFGQDVPDRDDFGETLNRFNAPRTQIGGLAWDGQYIWGTNRVADARTPDRLWCMNPANGEILHDYEINQLDAIGLGFDHTTGLFWVNEWVDPAQGSSVAHLYDSEGRQVSTLRLPRGGHWDFCFDDDWVYGSSEGNSDINAYRIYRMNREAGRVTEGPNLRAIANHGRSIAVTLVPQHLEGNFWLMSVSYISQFNIDWDNEEAQLIREFRSNNNDYPHQGLTHDGLNLWGGGNWNGVQVCVYDDGITEIYGEIGIDRESVEFNPTVRGERDEQILIIRNLAEVEDEIHVLDYTVTDLGGDPDWLQIDPAGGSINARGSAEVTLTAITQDLEVGEYERDILIEANDLSQLQTTIPVHLLVVDGRGSLSGQVTNASNGSALEGAIITSERFDYTDTSDENGNYSFDDIAAWDYTFHVTHVGYLPDTLQIEISTGDNLQENFALLHGEFSPRPSDIEVQLLINDTLDLPLNLSNPGDGPLTWNSIIDLPDELEQNPWTIQRTYNISEILNDERIQGITFADDHFYIAGTARNQKLIYVVNRDGEHVATFPQLSPSRYGFSSLTWDGELLWGAADQTIYGFNTAGDSVTSFVGPHNPSTNIVWDSDREVFWLSGATTNIVSCDREGNVQTTLLRRGMRMYGLGYFPEDPDGCNLYAYTNPTENRKLVMKVNTTNNDTMRVIELADDGGRPAGCTISNIYNPYTWTFLGISNIGGNDVLYDIYLSTLKDWIRASPLSGVIPAGSTEEVSLYFDSHGLTPDIVYEASIRYSHDGFGGSAEIPLALSVSLEGELVERVVSLDLGWNLVSTNMVPERADDFAGLMGQLVADGHLILAKDGLGHFYWPARQFDGIDEWNVLNGYWLKVTGSSELHISGEPIPGDSPIALNAGWNTVSYLPRQPIVADIGFVGLGENLIIVRDGRGRFYLPAYNYNDLDRLHQGAGYQVRVSEADELVYSRGLVASFKPRYNQADVAWIESLPRTPLMHSLVLCSNLATSTRLEASTPSGMVAGRGVVGEDGLTGLTLWGDDPMTEAIEGFANGELPVVKIYQKSEIRNLKLVAGDITFTDGGWGVVELEATEVPAEFGLVSAYPNPFNSIMSLVFSLQKFSKTRLAVYDISGREVALLASGRLSSGKQSVVWNAEGLSAGVYLLRLEAEGRISTMKVVLVK